MTIVAFHLAIIKLLNSEVLGTAVGPIGRLVQAVIAIDTFLAMLVSAIWF